MENIVYTAPMCPFCTGAKSLLKKREIAFQEVMLVRSEENRELVKNLTGRSSFPQIILDGKSIGGFEELRNLDKIGKLGKQSSQT